MRLDPPTKEQHLVALALAVDISRDTCHVAAARIQTVIGPAIMHVYAQNPATDRQIEFGKTISVDVSRDSNLVASAKISDRLFVINTEAAAKLSLKPGDSVRVRESIAHIIATYQFDEEFVVSSVQPNGRVMFKGGCGRGAWAAQLELCNRQINY